MCENWVYGRCENIGCSKRHMQIQVWFNLMGAPIPFTVWMNLLYCNAALLAKQTAILTIADFVHCLLIHQWLYLLPGNLKLTMIRHFNTHTFSMSNDNT